MDSKDKVTGAKRREKIYFSINDIANPDLAFSQLFGHEKDREHWAVGISENISLAFIGRVNFGGTDFYVYNENNGDKYYAKTRDIGIGLGIPGVGASKTIVFLPKINTPQELDGYLFVVGGSLGIINGELIFDGQTSELAAFRLGISESAISLTKNIDLYGSVDSSILKKFKKLNSSQNIVQEELDREVNKLMKLASNKKEAEKNISEINSTVLKIKNILEGNRKIWK